MTNPKPYRHRFPSWQVPLLHSRAPIKLDGPLACTSPSPSRVVSCQHLYAAARTRLKWVTVNPVNASTASPISAHGPAVPGLSAHSLVCANTINQGIVTAITRSFKLSRLSAVCQGLRQGWPDDHATPALHMPRGKLR